MPDPDYDDTKNEIAEVEIPIEWNKITIGTIKAIIYEGEDVHICSNEADDKFLIAEGTFEGILYRVQSCHNGIDGVKKALKEEIESCLKRTW